MGSQLKKSLFDGPILSGATQYIPLHVHRGEYGGALGCQVAWKDATSDATITLELTSYQPDVVQDDYAAGAAWEWIDSDETIDGPTGAAAGGVLINIENVRQFRARLKIVAAADCDIEVLDGAG